MNDTSNDLLAFENALQRFEEQYRLSSRQFYELYTHGLLEGGDTAEDFSQWARCYCQREARRSTLTRLHSDR